MAELFKAHEFIRYMQKKIKNELRLVYEGKFGLSHTESNNYFFISTPQTPSWVLRKQLTNMRRMNKNPLLKDDQTF